MPDAYGGDWQSRRKWWANELAMRGPIPCRKCKRLVHARPEANWDGKPFDLGHGRDAVLGGDGGDARPEHRTCNRRAGGKLGNVRQYRRRASRDW